MRATAFLVRSDDAPGSALGDLAHRLEFDSVRNYESVAAAAKQAQVTPLLYFLFSAVPNLKSVKPIADAIRFSRDHYVRFAPLIYFAENPSLDIIRACINMGFDDVITLPFTQARVEERLQRQLERTLVYYETATYFGPDRRGRMADEKGHHNRGTGGQYRRLEISRNPLAGVHVIRDDLHVVL
jgi:hypothetical protein